MKPAARLLPIPASATLKRLRAGEENKTETTTKRVVSLPAAGYGLIVEGLRRWRIQLAYHEVTAELGNQFFANSERVLMRQTEDVPSNVVCLLEIDTNQQTVQNEEFQFAHHVYCSVNCQRRLMRHTRENFTETNLDSDADFPENSTLCDRRLAATNNEHLKAPQDQFW